MSTKKNLVIYHANCVDGFAAAWAASKFLEETETEYFACNYGEVYKDLLGDRIVCIVDFSFSRDELVRICAFAFQVTVLDHHKTAQEALESWTEKPTNLTIVFDMERSGAGITWDWLSARFLVDSAVVYWPDRPLLVEYVEDRDLWKFILSHSKEVNAFISSFDKNFDSYDLLQHQLHHNFHHCVATGVKLLQQHQSICEDISENISRPITINSQQGLACNCTGHFASEVGNILAKKSGTYGATFFQDSKGDIKFSLRSIGDFDVSAIAKLFGGGGHKNAAGFTLKEFGSGNRKEITLLSTESER